MANTPSLDFTFRFIGDGTSASAVISLVSGPISYSTPSTTYPVLNQALSGLTASGVTGLAATGIGVTGGTVSLGTLTVNFTRATTLNTFYMVTGTLEF